MVEKGIRGGMCHIIHWNTKAKNKYMKDYDPKKESLYPMSWDVNNWYGWGISHTLPLESFKSTKELFWSNEKFIYKTMIKTVTKDTHPKELQKQHSDLPFLLERTKVH